MLHHFSKIPLAERSLYYTERTLPLTAMAGSIGRSRIVQPGYDWHGLRRGKAEFALMQYTLAGRGALTVGNREFTPTPGTAMLLSFPAENHYWFPEGSEQWEFFYLCLHGRETMRIWARAMAAMGPLAILEPQSRLVQCAADLVRDGLKGEIATPYAASARAYEILMLLTEEATTSAAPKGNPGVDHAEALSRARHYGLAHFAENPGVADLAKEAGLSKFHFTRLFASSMGVSPAAWLADLRVKEAARLLRSSSLSMKEIASQCGFTDPSYMGKVFRQRTGQSPGDYRLSGI